MRLRSGGEQRILVHLEIQTSFEEAFEARIARYNCGLFWVLIWQAKGEARGRASLLVTQLRKQCGPLTEENETRIRKMSLDRLDALGEALLDFRSLQDLESWLDSTEKPTG